MQMNKVFLKDIPHCVHLLQPSLNPASMTLSGVPKHDQTLQDPEVQNNNGKTNNKAFKKK